MADVSIVRQWPDEDVLRITVTVEESFPDAIAQARAEAVRAYGEALGFTTAALEMELAADVDEDEG